MVDSIVNSQTKQKRRSYEREQVDRIAAGIVFLGRRRASECVVRVERMEPKKQDERFAFFVDDD